MSERARRPGTVLAVLVGAQLLGVANANLIAVALPSLSRELAPTPSQQQWIVDAYVLVLASALICAGALSDRLGRRRLLTGGLLLFAAASLACALVTSPAVLIALRAVQAIGPALVLPASLAVLATTYPDRTARARALGLWGAASGLGIALGPLLGGVVVSVLSWRWAFAVNVPAALALAGLAMRLIAPDRPARAEHPVDLLGAALIVSGMACLVFAIIQGPHDGWASAPVLLAAGLAVALMSAFTRAERRHPAPLVDLRLLAHRPFLVANAAAGTVLFVSLGASVYLSAFLQEERSYSALATGLALLPLGIGTGLLAVLSGRLTAHLHPPLQIAAGLACCAAGTLLLTGLDAGTSAGSMLVGLGVLGAGAGIALPASTATAVSSAPAERTGMASAIHNASRQLGATLGVAVVGSIVSSHTSSQAGAHAYAAGLNVALLVCAGCLAVTTAACLALSLGRQRVHASG